MKYFTKISKIRSGPFILQNFGKKIQIVRKLKKFM